MEVFYFNDESGKHKTFRYMRSQDRGGESWNGSSVDVQVSQDLKFLSGGPWPLPPTPEIREPSTSKIRPPFWLSMLGSPSLGLPDPVLHGEAKLFPTEPAASSLSLLV